MKSPVTWLLVALGAAGVVLRFVTVSPLWLDEALSAHIAASDEPLAEALRRDGHPALYYLLLGWWIDLFGVGEGSVRALSGVFSLAAVPFIALTARRHDGRVAFAAAVLALTSPYLMRYGTEARMYALLVLEVAVGWWAVERALDRPVFVRLVVVAAAAAALVHTHYWAVFVVLAGPAALVSVAVSDPARRVAVIRVVVAIGAGCATLVVWLGVFVDQLAHTGTPWAKRARPTEVLIETVQAIGGNSRFEGETLGYWLLALAIVGMTAAGRAEGSRLILDLSLRGRPQAIGAAFVGTLVLASTAALVASGGFEGRYSAVVVPFAIVLAARGVMSFPARTAWSLLCLLALFGVAIGVDEARRDRSQGREVAAAVNAGAGPGDVVVFCPDQIGPATVHYLDVDISRVAYPRGDGFTVDWRDYLDTIAARDPAAFARDVTAGADDVWLVGSNDYRGFETRCDRLAAELGRTRSPEVVVAERKLFEPMSLVRYSPRQ